jgi:hypothetical protein
MCRKGLNDMEICLHEAATGRFRPGLSGGGGGSKKEEGGCSVGGYICTRWHSGVAWVKVMIQDIEHIVQGPAVAEPLQ